MKIRTFFVLFFEVFRKAISPEYWAERIIEWTEKLKEANKRP